MGAPAIKAISENQVLRKELQLEVDTFHLYLDYPDPFLPTPDSSGMDTITKKNDPPGPAVFADPPRPVKETLSSILRFNGTILNPQKRSKVAFITFREKEYLVREGDKIENIRIKKIDKNRIAISYKGEILVIKK